MNKQKIRSDIFFYVLIRSWNAFEYFDRCIDSVLNQTYKNFKILFVDDCSEYTTAQKGYINKRLKNHIVEFNKKRVFSVLNVYKMISKFAKKDGAVILNLDGDDWLLDSKVLDYLAKVYKNSDCLLTYGECLLWDGKEYSSHPSRFIKKRTNIPYPKKVVKNSSYRLEPFYPLHPRAWKVWLYKKIKKEDFLRYDGSWLEFAEDQAMFFPMLEMANGRYKVIKKPLYAYHVGAKQSDIKQNLIKLLKDELIIRKKKPYEPLF